MILKTIILHTLIQYIMKLHIHFTLFHQIYDISDIPP